MSKGVAVFGASGRMGHLLVECVEGTPSFHLSSAVVSANSRALGRSAGSKCLYSSDVESAIRTCDVAIDFSVAEAVLEHVKESRAQRKPILIGTTGLSEATLREIEEASREIPLALVANTSLGVFAMVEALGVLRSILGSDFDVEISETHHRGKRDAPSGTALLLARAVSVKECGAVVIERAGRTQPRQPGEIGISSTRGGDVPGEHTVFFLGDGETLEISHRVRDRRIFAKGALILSERLMAASPGRVLGVKDLML